LKLHDSVLVVPTFYGFYTTISILNSYIYLNQLDVYKPYALALVVIGVFSLIYGVSLLSQAKGGNQSDTDKTQGKNDEENDDDDGYDYEDKDDYIWDDTSTITVKTSDDYSEGKNFTNIYEGWINKLSSFFKTKGNNNDDSEEMKVNKKWQIWNWNKKN
jgi:hypothetical protein